MSNGRFGDIGVPVVEDQIFQHFGFGNQAPDAP